MSSWTAASSDCSRPVNNYVHVKTADLYRPNARLTPERQGYQVLTLFGKLGYSPKGIATGKSANDDNADWQAAYALFPGRIAYAWMSSLALPVAARGLDACGFVRRSLIIWDKGHIVIGRGRYHWRHETCWYAVKKGAQANWTGDRKASTLWEIDNPRKSETGHSAQKPVECMQRAIHNHRGDVYDPFVGSGTTLIAGEQEGRSVYAIEIEPAYVDVTVKRWEEFTGQKAQRKQ